MSAAEIMIAGMGDILSSDYAPMSLSHAVFKLVRLGQAELPEAVRWISLNPARAVGLDAMTGSLEAGKQADLVIVDPSGPVPQITTTYTAGCLTYRSDLPFRREIEQPRYAVA